MALPVPPAPPAPAPIASFRELYLDSSKDEDGGNPTSIMNVFDPAHVVAAPAALYDAVLREDDLTTKAFLCLEQDPAQPNRQGTVTIIYGVKQYRHPLGQPANDWTDRVFAFTGDVLNRNAPTSVELGPAMFHLIAGAAALRVYTAETINLLLAADPTVVAIDCPDVMNPGWEDVRCRRCFPIPFQYVAPFLARSLPPRDAFISVFQTATSLAQVNTVRPLLRWLAVCLTRDENLPAGTDHSRAGTPYLLAPRTDPVLQDHRWRLVIWKLPGLSLAPTTVGASQISGALGEVVQQIRGIRADADTRTRVASSKSPQEYYGPLLDQVLRLAQVGSPDQLQPVHQALAENKKLARKVWQQYVNATAATLCYQGLNIIISGAVANKLADVDIGTPLL
jgi:hypothetical protein